MKFPAFDYAAPSSIAEAVALLASDDDARPLAGGQTLLPILALRMASPSCLVDLHGIEALRAIETVDGTVRIGAMVTHARNLNETSHRTQLPLLSEAVRHVAHEAVRNRGTIGGSIAYADAAAEMPLVALAMDATLCVVGPAGERRVAAGDFFVGHYATALDDSDLLTHIEFPITDHAWAFEEVARRPGDFALVSAAAGLRLTENRCTSARIAIGSVADRPVRAPEAEAFLNGQEITAAVASEAARLATADLRSHADVHASAEYRRQVGATLIKRALLRAAAKAQQHG